MKWKQENENVHRCLYDGINIMIHRRAHEPHRWFLTIENSPLTIKRYPLMELDIDGAKKEALDRLLEKADDIRNSLHVAARRDSKVIQSFKLRLVAILNEAETLEAIVEARNYFERSALDDQLQKMIGTIRTAMSDLD